MKHLRHGLTKLQENRTSTAAHAAVAWVAVKDLKAAVKKRCILSSNSVGGRN